MAPRAPSCSWKSKPLAPKRRERWGWDTMGHARKGSQQITWKPQSATPTQNNDGHGPARQAINNTRRLAHDIARRQSLLNRWLGNVDFTAPCNFNTRSSTQAIVVISVRGQKVQGFPLGMLLTPQGPSAWHVWTEKLRPSLRRSWEDLPKASERPSTTTF